jgi:serine/threonine-protein kinase
LVGHRCGNYKLLRLIGKGGMGDVYLGEHELLGRTAAVKVLSPALTGPGEGVQRFLREAVATTQIRHPGIVHIYDFGHTDDGRAFLVMELLEGEELQHRLERVGRIEVASAMTMGRQIASALVSAHGAGIIHRDLKPANVFLVEDLDVEGGERIKLIDFGIAKLVQDPDNPERSLTRTGGIVGTPIYMAPEQCRGGRLDPRADVYSLGCVLFHMIAGRPPFLAQSIGDLIVAHATRTPPRLGDYAPEGSGALEQLVTAMLAKSPEARPTAAAVQSALERLGATPSTGFEIVGRRPASPAASFTPTPHPMAPAPRRDRLESRAIAVAVAAVAAAAVIIAIAASGGEPSGPPESAAAASPGETEATIIDAAPATGADAGAALASPPIDAAVAAPPLDAAPVREVTVTIRSRPSRVAVRLRRGGAPAGRTPYRLSLPVDDFPVAVWLAHPGYVSERVLIRGPRPAERTVELRRHQIRPATLGDPELEDM